MEVARSETCVSFPSMVASCGTVVTWPSQEPARVFILSKDFCASDWVVAAAAAKAVAAIRMNTTEVAMRDFMVSVSLFLCFFLFFKCSCGNLFGLQKHIPPTSDVVNYNTITNASFILLKSEIQATSETSGLASKKYSAERRQAEGGTASTDMTAL